MKTIKKLAELLQEACEDGTLDELPPECANPESVNDFCDAVRSLTKQESDAEIKGLTKQESDAAIKGIEAWKLFSHKPGEQFIYYGRLFTRLVFPHSLLSYWSKDSQNKPEVLEMLRTSNKMYGKFFLAADQNGVVAIFYRNELVVTINKYSPPVETLVDL